MKGKVYFVGAGPGDPELLTLKAKRVLEQADVIVFADSLVNPEVLKFAKKGAEVYGSSSLSLEEIAKIVLGAIERGKLVARLQSGDPSVYGALWEQTKVLEENGVEYEIVPGVSSLFAACASLKVELTVPGISQTVILSRRAGNAPVPRSEDLRSLASHRATMAIFLSISQIEEVVEELLEGGYPPETPVAVVYKASWEDEKVIEGNLEEVVPKVRESGIERQALILVGEALKPGEKGKRSKVYGRKR